MNSLYGIILFQSKMLISFVFKEAERFEFHTHFYVIEKKASCLQCLVLDKPPLADLIGVPQFPYFFHFLF